MRAFLRKQYINLAAHFARVKKGVYIMNGHYLSRQSANDPELFKAQLKQLQKQVRFINIQQACEWVMSGQAADVDETLVAFTFDDGFTDCFESLAPALEHFSVNACFFVNPGFIDGDSKYKTQFTEQVVRTTGKQSMDWQQCKSLVERGFVIGNHTHDHKRLSGLSNEEAEQQVATGKQRIEQELGINCEHFAWPYGQKADVTAGQISMLQRHHKYLYSGCNFTQYTDFAGAVLNRRHFEADWRVSDVKYFLSKPRTYAQHIARDSAA